MNIKVGQIWSYKKIGSSDNPVGLRCIAVKPFIGTAFLIEFETIKDKKYWWELSESGKIINPAWTLIEDAP